MSMTELEIEEHGWDREDWTLPLVMPRELDTITTVGVPLSYYATIYDFKDAWFTYDPLNWEIKPFRRRELYNMIKKRFDLWKEWLPYDSTRTFHQTISSLKKHSDGGIIGLAGPKGSSKSVGGSMMTERVVPEDDFAHVIFKYADIEKKTIGREDIAIVIQVDEDTKATGHDSKNLVVHVNNAFETSRKAELWAICTGVNLNFSGWGDTLDLRLIPFGFNRDFQATRFAAFDKNMDLIGLIVLQRKHLPTRPVYYYDDLGTWSTYKARARAFSISVSRKGGATDAVDSSTQTQHIEEFKLWLKENRIDKGLEIPNEVKCRRLYRKAELPSKSVGYMKEVILWAIDELEETPQTGYVPTVTEGWKGLRDAIYRWLVRQKVRAKTAHYLADWYIWTGETQEQIGAKYGVGRDAINKSVGRYADIFTGKESELGIVAEKWVEAHTDSLAPVRGSGGRDHADLLLTVHDLEVAVNVKLNLEDKYRRHYDSTPEDQWRPLALLAVVHPHTHTVRLFPITGPQTYAHWEQGVPCAPEDLVQTIEELIEG